MSQTQKDLNELDRLFDKNRESSEVKADIMISYGYGPFATEIQKTLQSNETDEEKKSKLEIISANCSIFFFLIGASN